MKELILAIANRTDDWIISQMCAQMLEKLDYEKHISYDIGEVHLRYEFIELFKLLGLPYNEFQLDSLFVHQVYTDKGHFAEVKLRRK